METRILNTKGAANMLHVSETWIHKLVYGGKLKAHIYNEQGELIERESDDRRQGQGLYFLEEDIQAYQQQRKKSGRPVGAKDKRPRVLKSQQNTSENP